MEGERERHVLYLKDLNLICALCGGYFIDATTIVECCHTFCKTCIVKHITSDNVEINKETGKKRSGADKFCPMCEVQLHKTKPLLSLRPDSQIQKLVYMVVPRLYRDEAKRRAMFYCKRDLWDSAECKRMVGNVIDYPIFNPDDTIIICLQYYNRSDNGDPVLDENEEVNPNEVPHRYLRCPSVLRIRHLKRFLRKKFLLTDDHPVNIYYQGKKKKGREDNKAELLQETYTLMDIGYIFEWDYCNSPMQMGYQILKRQMVLKTADMNQVIVAESSSTSPLEETVMDRIIEISEEQIDQPGQMRDLRLGKKRIRENTDNIAEDLPVPAKNSSRLERKSLGSDRNCLNSTPNNSVVNSENPNHSLTRCQEVSETVTVEDSNDTSDFSMREGKGDGSQAASPMETEELLVPEDEDVIEAEEISQAAESIEDQQDISQDIEVVVDVDGEPSQDFILQEEQAMDVSEELEEDDDEDRLRICDPEEIPEDRVSEEYMEEKIEESPVQPEVEEEKTENCIEEEAEVSRKESKSRRKNKKAKHHHRHRRDYSPAPEATIVSSDDKTDSLKLKVKITRSDSETSQGKNRSKQDESSRYYKLNDGHNSPRQSKHKNCVISEGMYNNTEQSPSHSNNDEDSRNSQSTDDHEVRSIASSKESHDEVSGNAKGSPLQNGNLDTSKTNNREIPNKEKLLQMRQVRHKNITPPPPRAPLNTTISKVSAEEASKNSLKAPIMYTSPNPSLTVSKVTAEEKMMNERKMLTNNSFEKQRPSLEIIPVNNPSSMSKSNENKSLDSQSKQKMLQAGNPVVKLMNSNLINALIPNQKSLSAPKVKCTNVDISNNSEVFKVSKEGNISGDKKTGVKKRENCGVLDLSEKSTRSSCSSPASEESNSPSPHQPLSASQPLINRHLASMNSPHRSSSSSPPVTASISKGSPTRPMQHPSFLSDLMTLTDTAVHIRNMKAAQVQDGIRRQLSATQNKSSPQRHPSVPSPGKSPSRASPTQLKIPTPNLTNKLASVSNRPKLPTHPTSLPNRVPPYTTVVNGCTYNVLPKLMNSQSAAIVRKQAEITGRIPPPPPAMHINELYRINKIRKTFDVEKIAQAIEASRKAKYEKRVAKLQESTVPKIPSS